MENQVLSIEQMKSLIELGVDVSKASMCWYEKSDKYILCNKGSLLSGYFSKIPTFTLQDILNYFDTYSIKNFSNDITLEVKFKGSWVQSINGDNILNIAFNMLKWVKENKYI